jgi:hypothetical protein
MQLRIITVDFLYVRQNVTKFDTKHAKRAVLFRLKSNETYETACFASQRNFAKQPVCFAKHETCFVSCFAKYETKLVSLETLVFTVLVLYIDGCVNLRTISLGLNYGFVGSSHS